MRRTQVYLPEELHERVRRISFEQRKSMAQVVRDAVSLYVDTTESHVPQPWDEELAPLDEPASHPEQDLSPGELERLKQNPLFRIIGLVSEPSPRRSAGRADDDSLSDLP